MVQLEYTCQDCGLQGTEKTEFKMVKYKNFKFVLCLECVELLQSRNVAEKNLQEAHTTLENADPGDWNTAHKEYKRAYRIASQRRHAQTIKKYGLTH